MFSSTLIQEMQGGVVTSLYLLCCILRIVKIKDLANTIAAALFYPLEAFTKSSWGKFNGHISDDGFTSKTEVSDYDNINHSDPRCSMINVPYTSSSSGFHSQSVLTQNDCSSSNLSLRYKAFKSYFLLLISSYTKNSSLFVFLLVTGTGNINECIIPAQTNYPAYTLPIFSSEICKNKFITSEKALNCNYANKKCCFSFASSISSVI